MKRDDCVRCGWTEEEHNAGPVIFRRADGQATVCSGYVQPAPRWLVLVNRLLSFGRG